MNERTGMTSSVVERKPRGLSRDSVGEASKDGTNVGLMSGEQKETKHKKKREERRKRGHVHTVQKIWHWTCLYENV